MQRIFIALAKIISGKKRFQPLFEMLHIHALTAMNIGKPASYVATSGEIAALKEIEEGLSAASYCFFDVGANTGEYVDALKNVFAAREGGTRVCLRASACDVSEIVGKIFGGCIRHAGALGTR